MMKKKGFLKSTQPVTITEIHDLTEHAAFGKCFVLGAKIIIEIKQIRDRHGHSDMSTTANFYSHLDAVKKTETGVAMSKALG